MTPHHQPRSLLFIISEEEFGALVECAETRSVSRGESILQKGDVNAKLFVIQSGNALVWESGPDGVEELARLGPGNFFGEMSVFCPGPVSANVNAASDAKLIVLSGRALNGFLETHPETGLKLYPGLLGELSRRLRQTDADYFAKVQYAATLLKQTSAGPAVAKPVFGGFGSEEADLFSALTDAERERLMEYGEQAVYGERDVLLEQGQESRALWLIESGAVDVRFRGDDVTQAVARIPEGAFFGEVSLFAGGTTSASISAAKPTRVRRFSREALERYAEESPAAACTVYRRMLEVLIKRTIAITSQLTHSAFDAWL